MSQCFSIWASSTLPHDLRSILLVRQEGMHIEFLVLSCPSYRCCVAGWIEDDEVLAKFQAKLRRGCNEAPFHQKSEDASRRHLQQVASASSATFLPFPC